MRFPKLARALVLTLTLAFLTVGIGCSSKPDDTQISQTIQFRIHKDSAIAGDVSVETAGGVVTLKGQVSNDASRELAARDASGIPGVKMIVNNLTVAPPITAESIAPPTPAMPAKPVVKVQPKRAVQNLPRKEVAATKPQPEPVAVAPAPAAPPATTAAAPMYPPPPSYPPPPPTPTKYTIPAGTPLSVRLIDSLDSSKNRVGDTFRASLDAPIRLDGEVVIPAGIDLEGRLIEVSDAGKYTGHPELRLELTKLMAQGETYALRTDEYSRSEGGRGKGTAGTIGTGAGLGAIIGGIAGGGKGAAIGAIAGAGAGGVVRGAEKAPKILLPSETVLSFNLQQSVTVPASIAGARGSERYSNRSSEDSREGSRPTLKRR